MRVPVSILLFLMTIVPGWNPTLSIPKSNPGGSQYVPNELLVCFRESVPIPETNVYDAKILAAKNPALTQLSAERGLIAVEGLLPGDLPRVKGAVSAKRPPHSTAWPPAPEEVARIFHYYGLDRTFVLRFSQPIDPVQRADQLMRDHSNVIEYAEPNTIRHFSREPNDPRYRSQWHLSHKPSNPSFRADVRAREAWDITTGSSDVVIAVLDTGATPTHEDLTNKFLTGRSFVSGVRSATDDHGHGTAVSGAAAANTDNGLDVAGVCWNCRILPLKILDRRGNGTLSAEVQAINYAVTEVSGGVRIINLSLGSCGGSPSSSERNALQAAGAAGILVVAAAGNGCEEEGVGSNNDETREYPGNFSAELENVVSVASSGRTNRLSYFSNFGRMSVMLAAPGEAIYTTVPTDTSLEISNAGGVLPIAGTSFAAPIVAGVAGLIYSQFPGITPAQVRARLVGSVDRYGDFLTTTSSGGRVNAFRALEQDGVAPGPITDLQAQAGSSPTTLTWTAPGDDDQQGQAMFYEVRYSRNEITADNFDRATKVDIAPFPQAAGAAESLPLVNLPRGTYVFAIRAIDNVGNKGPISSAVMAHVNE
ncbi:MAG: S8 family serine peptidase [Acidobacteria bacterium]|nr:S8 family serine peptidase [Acidobacteriota bacterium]